jgi:hypothetical protein
MESTGEVRTDECEDLFALAVDLSALALPLFGSLSSEYDLKLHRLIERARDLTSTACTFCEEPSWRCGCDEE